MKARNMRVITVMLVFLVVVIQRIQAVVYEMPMPRHFQACFDEYEKRTDLYKSVGNLINWECIQKCSNHLATSNYYGESNADVDWFQDLVRQMNPYQPCNPKKKPLRVRKEIRRLTESERRRLFRAIKILKHKPYGNTTRYDFIATMHSGELVPMAHFGPNFLPWHRFYLLLYENALRQIDSSVVLAYWDTGLDSAMWLAGINPIESIMWSDAFMGNGDGEVTTGIFRNWSTATGPLVRNYGTIPDLVLNDLIVNAVVNQTHLAEISTPTADPMVDLEFWHGAPHVWLSGHMGGINTAAWEPTFFLYHCYVDYIFERWSQNAKAAGTDVENEWPETATGLHAYGSTFGFGNYTNIQGMSSYFTNCVYRYEPKPTCTAADISCGSDFLTCNVTSDFGPMCRSKSRGEVSMSNQTSCDRYLYNDGMQNTFCCDGDCSTKNWVYLPVEVVQYRPPEYKSRHAHPVLDNYHIDREHDIYTSVMHSDLAPPKTSKKLATYGQCSMDVPHDIIIETTGLNYKGHYYELALPDNRLPLSKTTVFLAVKKPEPYRTKMFLSASDSCGRVCKIFCRDKIYRDTFHACSGAFAIVNEKPLQYGCSIEDVIYKMWDIKKGSCPSSTEVDINIRIFCDYSADWIWNSTTPDWMYHWKVYNY